MALDLNVLQKDITYFKDLKPENKPRIFNGEDRTFSEIEIAMKNKANLSLAERALVESWVTELDAKKDYLTDNVAKTRLEALKKELPVITTTPTSTLWVPATIPDSSTPESAKSEIEAALKTITDSDFDTMKSGIEKAQSIISAFEKLQPQYREGMRGALWLMLLERFARAGYSVSLTGNTIHMTSSKPENASRATQIETYLRGQSGMVENLALGMIYRSSEIGNYSAVYLEKDKKSIKPETPRNYIEYLRDTQKGKVSLPNDLALIQSQGSIDAILRDQNKVKWLMIGTPFLTDAMKAMQADPSIAEAAQKAATNSPTITTATPSNTPQNPPSTPIAPKTNTPLPGWDQDPVNRTLAEIGQGFSWGLNKLMTTPGAFSWLLLATIATMIFGGFKKGLMVFGGGIGLSGIVDIYDRNKNAIKAWATWVADAASEAAEKARKLAGGNGSTEAWKEGDKKWDEKKDETTWLTEAQKYLRSSVTSDTVLKNKVDQLANTKGTPSPGKLDDYLNYIEKDLSDTPLSKIFPTEHTKSIFHDSANTELTPNTNLWVKMFKRVMRAYLVGTGYDTLSGAWDTQWKSEKEAFLKNMEITEDDIKNKKLSDILTRLQSKRSGGTKPVENPKEDPVKTPDAKKPDVLKSHKIGNIDIDIGKNVQLKEWSVPRNEKWEPLINSTIEKHANGSYFIPADSVVTLGDSAIKIGALTYIKIKYKGEDMFIHENSLKPIK